VRTVEQKEVHGDDLEENGSIVVGRVSGGAEQDEAEQEERVTVVMMLSLHSGAEMNARNVRHDMRKKGDLS
jgi:hypothetical protein